MLFCAARSASPIAMALAETNFVEKKKIDVIRLIAYEISHRELTTLA
jgi:hypothetical protein